MKAARLLPGATRLAVEEIPDPVLQPGSVIVRISAAFVSHFITKVTDGSGGYAVPPKPFTPGMDAIGWIESVAAGVRGLAIGDRIYCDTYFEPQQFGSVRERAFIGNFALGTQSLPLLDMWPDGVFAEKMCLPAECAIPIRPDLGTPPEILCRLGWLGTAYAGLKKAQMAAGATVAIMGASGILGSSAVALALAMGARRVYAIGRRKAALEAVARLDKRIIPLTDVATMEPVDVALSSVDGPDSSMLEAMLPRIKCRGSLVFVGATKAPLQVNPGLLLGNEISLKGSLWFQRSDIGEILAMAEAGVLSLSAFGADTFPLSRIGEALELACNPREDPLRHIAIEMG